MFSVLGSAYVEIDCYSLKVTVICYFRLIKEDNRPEQLCTLPIVDLSFIASLVLYRPIRQKNLTLKRYYEKMRNGIK
jgi:hypothetical protein